MSPQILSKQPYSSKCDIWSIGVIYYELLVGKHPFTARSMNDLYYAIINCTEVSFPEELVISEASQYFIRKCLQVEEISRYSWLELYENELMGEHFEAVAKRWR